MYKFLAPGTKLSDEKKINKPITKSLKIKYLFKFSSLDILKFILHDLNFP
jgi:hypothetical protein